MPLKKKWVLKKGLFFSFTSEAKMLYFVRNF
jgi:hypothetical protein